MAEDAPIVEDTRRVRRLISGQFGHDLDKYIAYLLKKKATPGSERAVRETK